MVLLRFIRDPYTSRAHVEAKAYFDTDDFAEMYSSLEPTEDHPNIPAEAEARFKASLLYQKYIVEPLAQGASDASSSPEPRLTGKKKSFSGDTPEPPAGRLRLPAPSLQGRIRSVDSTSTILSHASECGLITSK